MELLLFVDVSIVRHVPLLHFCFWITSHLSLEIGQLLPLYFALSAQSIDQRVFKLLNSGRVLGHFPLKHHLGVTRIPKEQCLFLSLLN
jgi:hypothetical protein